MASVKLSERAVETLDALATGSIHEDDWPRDVSAVYLLRRGLVECLGDVWYRVTAEGFAALATGAIDVIPDEETIADRRHREGLA